jgi:hypothetical protein
MCALTRLPWLSIAAHALLHGDAGGERRQAIYPHIFGLRHAQPSVVSAPKSMNLDHGFELVR